MDIHEWIGEYARRAIEARDRERYDLVVICGEALPRVARDPDQALHLLEQGHALAQRLEESWWTRFFEHWMIQALLFRKRNVQAALPLARAAVAATTAPEYEEFPQRICLREDLIFSFLGRDPRGHSREIEQAVEYMQAEIAPDCPCIHCLQEIRTAYPLALGRWDEAEQAALNAVKMAWPASDYHHVLGAYAALCQIAAERQDWAKLAHWAGMGETFVGRDVGMDSVLELLMWQAVATLRHGDSPAASEQYKRARQHARAYRALPSAGYFDALFAYHQSDLRRALAVCDLELRPLAGNGQAARECLIRLRRCRLLAALGRPVSEESAQIRALAQMLADPQLVLSDLAGLCA